MGKVNLKFSPLRLFTFVLLTFIVYSSFMICCSNAIAIMSIDFGSEWMKIGVVAPGVPMEIGLNFESKRKTPVCISFRDGVRTLGEDACNTGLRFPHMNYMFLLDLLGKEVDSPSVQLYKKRFPYYQIEPDPDRNTVVFRHDEKTTYTVEELIAQILNHARDIAMAHTNQKIKDVVITVPAYFQQAERRALLDAATLAGLKVLSLMSDNAAVALNYGMFRRQEINETAQNILFYDMGSSSTLATIASYQMVKTKERGYTETNPQVSIIGIGFDRSLGGFDMQIRLRDYLANEFNKMKKDKKTDVRDSPRAMAKLLKAADKLRTVLSANSEHIVQVEGVLNDEDFKLKVKRETFEEICDDLLKKVTQPIDAALVSANLDLNSIHQVLIVGGGTRVPKVKKILSDYLKMELGMNINADEAAALGAVYRAADLGQGFKVKKFHVKESVLHPIQVDFERSFEKEDGSMDSKVVRRSLFPLMNSIPQKKVMTFNKHRADFGFSVNYDLQSLSKQHLESFKSEKLHYVMVEGVTEAFQKYLEDEYTSKGIRVHFQVCDSGLLSITSIEAQFEKNLTTTNEKEETKEKEDDSILSKLSRFVTGNDGNNTDSENQTEESSSDIKKGKKESNGDTNENGKNSSNTNETVSKGKNKDSKSPKNKTVSVEVKLNFSVNYLDIKPLTEERRQESMEKLKIIAKDEKMRKDVERLKNSLETIILDIKDKFEDDDYKSVSTEEDRESILAKVSEHQEWFEYESTNVASDFETRLKELEKLMAPISNRVKEAIERPKALKELRDLINKSQFLYNGLKEAAENDSYLSEIVITNLEEKINSTLKWMEKKEKEQSEAPKTEDPLLTVSAIAGKMWELNDEGQRVVRAIKIASSTRERDAAAAAKKKAEEDKLMAEKLKDILGKNITQEDIEAAMKELEKENETTKVPEEEHLETTTTEDPKISKTDSKDGEPHREL